MLAAAASKLCFVNFTCLGGRFVVGVGSSWPHDFRFLVVFFSDAWSAVVGWHVAGSVTGSGLAENRNCDEVAKLVISTSSTSESSTLRVEATDAIEV